MASVPTDICNLALFRIRADEIGSLTERSVAAEKCRVLYPQARDTVLALNEVSWPFAKKTVALALQTEVPAEWCYGYAYPVDCLKALYILQESNGKIPTSRTQQARRVPDPVPFEIVTNEMGGSPVIATDKEDAVLAYVRKVEDVRLFGPLCVELIAWKLAQDLALPLAGDSGKYYRETAAFAFQKTLGEAAAAYKNQTQPKIQQQPPNSVQARS